MSAESLPWSAILGYGLGDAANNVGWQMTNLFLTTYYLYLGMDPMLVAEIFLGAHLFQALVYLVAGRITDGRDKDQEGGLRRLVGVFGLPMMISVTLMYTIPAGAPMAVRIGWAIATYLLYQLFGALGGVPYGALLGAMTRDPDDRQRLAASRTFGGAAAGVILTFTLAPRVNDMDPSRLFLPVVAACCLLGSLGYLIMARTTRERYLPPATPRTSLKEDLRLLVDNRPLLVVCLATLFMTNPVASLAPIVAKEVLTVGNPGLTGRITFALTLVGVLAGVVVAPCSPWLVQRLGKRGTWTLGGLMVIGSSLAFILVRSAWPAVACIALNGIGVQVITPCIWAMQADSVQYEQWRTGNGNTAGASMAALSITRQVGAAINGWAGPAILSFLGYRPGMNVAQDPALGANMRLAVGLVPAAMFTISVLLIRCYPLTEEVFGRISADLQAGRLQCQCSHIRQGTEHQACPEDPPEPAQGREGHRRVRMIDVAARAGVSPSTVSRALNNPGRLNSQTADHIRSLARSMGYPLPDHPPSRDATGPVMITFLVQDTSNGISSQILAGAQEALPEQGAVGIIEAGAELGRTEDLLEQLSGHTHGIILATDQVRAPTARRLGRHLPLVVLNRPMEGLPSVLPDASTGLAQALELLRRQGRRSIVYIASRVGAWSDRSRWESLQALSRTMGLECRRMGPVNPTVQGGRQAAIALEQEPPDAVVAYNDLIAAGVILGLQSKGITVPDRVGVLGFDNTMVAPVVKPAIATIRIPRRAIGHAAADILLGRKPETGQSRQQSTLIARLRKAGIPPVTEDLGALTLPTSLIIRDSLGTLTSSALEGV